MWTGQSGGRERNTTLAQSPKGKGEGRKIEKGKNKKAGTHWEGGFADKVNFTLCTIMPEIHRFIFCQQRVDKQKVTTKVSSLMYATQLKGNNVVILQS